MPYSIAMAQAPPALRKLASLASELGSLRSSAILPLPPFRGEGQNGRASLKKKNISTVLTACDNEICLRGPAPRSPTPDLKSLVDSACLWALSLLPSAKPTSRNLKISSNASLLYVACEVNGDPSVDLRMQANEKAHSDKSVTLKNKEKIIEHMFKSA